MSAGLTLPDASLMSRPGHDKDGLADLAAAGPAAWLPAQGSQPEGSNLAAPYGLRAGCAQEPSRLVSPVPLDADR